MHGPCRQTRKARECGAWFGVRHRIIISFHPDLGFSLTHPPLPRSSPPPSPAYSCPRGRGRRSWGSRGIQNLPSPKTNINNTNLRGGRFPCQVRGAVPRPRGRAGRAGDAERDGRRSQSRSVPSSTWSPSTLAAAPGGCQAAPGVARGEPGSPATFQKGKDQKNKKINDRVRITNPFVFPPNVPGNNRSH